MSFLESIQHGLEKASQEASRITKIQHFHNVINDLTFKASQQGQTLIAQAMDMYHNGRLGQGELVVICQQIATYEQQINEIQGEIQRLQQHEESAPQAPIPPVPSPAYSAYPQEAPTAPLLQPSDNSEPPTVPAQASQVAQEASPPPAKPKRHASTHKESSTATPPEAPASTETPATSAPGSYAQGVLPPVYSPFAAAPAPTTDASSATAPNEENAAATPAKPKAHHTKKAAAPDSTPESVAEAPVKE